MNVDQSRWAKQFSLVDICEPFALLLVAATPQKAHKKAPWRPRLCWTCVAIAGQQRPPLVNASWLAAAASFRSPLSIGSWILERPSVP